MVRQCEGGTTEAILILTPNRGLLRYRSQWPTVFRCAANLLQLHKPY